MSDELAAVALEWIRSALAEELPRRAPDSLERLAEELHQQVVEWNVPVEELLRWLHQDARKFSVTEFSSHCRWYVGFSQTMCQSATS